MSLPKFIDTQEWAKAQDRIFAGEAKLESALKFNAICTAQDRITPTNLTLRHRLIISSLSGAYPIDISRDHALIDFQSLRKGDYWAEGYSYWEYTKVGLNWYDKRHGLPADILEAMARISAAYEALMPCPFPEVMDLGNPVDGADFVSSPDYYRKLWKRDGKVVAALWICLNTDPEPRLNLHHHMEAGYFAFGRHEVSFFGESSDPMRGPTSYKEYKYFDWRHRCKPYTGFNFKESLTSSALADCLPKGAMPPTWRAKPPRLRVFTDLLYGDSPVHGRVVSANPTVRFTWNNGLFSKQTRTIEVLPEKVIVTDGGRFRRGKVTEYGV